MGVIVGYDPINLREKVDLKAAGERLDELGELRNATALNEKVTLLRLVGRLDEAWDMANDALRQARFSGDRQELCLARIRRALPAFSSRYLTERSIGELKAALLDFRTAVTIRVRIGAAADDVDSSMVAIAIAESYLDDSPSPGA